MFCSFLVFGGGRGLFLSGPTACVLGEGFFRITNIIIHEVWSTVPAYSSGTN